MNDVLEKFAEKQHDIWSHWMKWMFENGGEKDSQGNWRMYPEKEVRWRGQMDTPYFYLTEKEKQSDRDVVAEHGLLDVH